MAVEIEEIGKGALKAFKAHPWAWGLGAVAVGGLAVVAARRGGGAVTAPQTVTPARDQAAQERERAAREREQAARERDIERRLREIQDETRRMVRESMGSLADAQDHYWQSALEALNQQRAAYYAAAPAPSERLATIEAAAPAPSERLATIEAALAGAGTAQEATAIRTIYGVTPAEERALGYPLPTGADVGAGIHATDPGPVYRSTGDAFIFGRGPATTPEAIAANESRLQSDPAFVAAEIIRTQAVISNRQAAGMDTSLQEAYLKRLQTGSWRT